MLSRYRRCDGRGLFKQVHRYCNRIQTKFLDIATVSIHAKCKYIAMVSLHVKFIDIVMVSSHAKFIVITTV